MRSSLQLVVTGLALVAGIGLAQGQPAPATAPPGMAAGTQALQPPPPRSSFHRLFAGTLAAVLQTTAAAVTVGVPLAVTGGLTQWFNKKLKVDALPMPVPGEATYPVESGDYGVSPQYYDAASGAPSAPVEMVPGDAALYAGVAYEVHALGADGSATPVNPATHEFRTGDRFVLYYRPTLPGRMDVYNINPAGQETQIDSAEIAAGQLAQLGPYEFAALTGDEQLRLVLAPCTNAELAMATRDIVKVEAPTEADAGLQLAPCGLATRSATGMRTRDIRKVAVEGTTGFALDPLSAQESSSGQVAPREIRITFRHL